MTTRVRGWRRQAALAAALGICAVFSPAHAATANGEVDPRVRYQLLSVAIEATDTCDLGDREFEARIRKRRDSLAQDLIARDRTDAGDLAEIRERARDIFRAEGCDSRAIADLVATVRRVETE